MGNESSTLLETINWETLRDEGLKKLQALSGHLWTDYRIHDPGVTILEVLCYAIADLDSRLSSDIGTILADNTIPEQFFSPKEILTINPVTINDYRKLLIDIRVPITLSNSQTSWVPAVKNAWLVPAIDTDPDLYFDKDNNALLYDYAPNSSRITLNGLYRVYIEKDEDIQSEDELKSMVAAKLNSHRNLCEEFVEIKILEQETISVFSDIQITGDADANEVMAKIYYDLKNFIAPRVKQYSLKRMLTKGKSIEQIFNGPQLEHGFIDDDELGTGEKRKELHTSDLIRIIMSHKEVKDVRNLFITNVANPSITDKQEWALAVDDTKALVLEPLNSTKIRLFKNESMCPISSNEVNARLDVLKAQSQWEIFDDPATDLKEAVGETTDLTTYESMAYKLPSTYGISETGLPSAVPEKRRAQAKQLRAYLLFFEQILVNYLQQLASFKHIFAFRQNRAELLGKIKTYFSQPLPASFWQEDFPELNPEINSVYQYLEDDPDDRILMNENAFKRKNRILDHLLAQFNEKFADYAVFGFKYNMLMNLDRGQKNSYYLAAKADFLENYPRLSRNRNRAYNLLTPIPDIPAFQYTDGLKDLIASKLGLDVYITDPVSRNEFKNFFIVEHILLRPEGFLPLGFISSEKITEPYQPDPYSYQVTFVIPKKTGRFGNNKFKELVYTTIENETPAHIAYTVLEFDPAQMLRFTDLYVNFLKWRQEHPDEYNPFRNLLLDLLGVGRIKLPVLHLDAHQVHGNENRPGNGDSVTEWRDLSRNNHHTVPVPTKDAPEYIESDLPWVRFSSNAQSKIAASLIRDDFSVIMVYKAGAESGHESDHFQLIAGADANQSNFGLYFTANGDLTAKMNSKIMNWESTITMNLESTPGLPHLAIYTREKATGEVRLYLDGTLQATQELKNANVSLVQESIIIGPGADGATCELGEVIILDSVLAGIRKQKLEEYLSAKWRIPLSAVSSIAKPVLHLDAGNSSSLILDKNAKQIRQWKDLSLDGVTITQSNIAAPPEYQVEGIAGLPAVYFKDNALMIPNSGNVLKVLVENMEDNIIAIIKSAIINVMLEASPVSPDSFTVISGINPTLSHAVWNDLKNEGYIDDHGNKLPAFAPDRHSFTLDLDAALLYPVRLEFERKISAILSRYSASQRPVSQDTFTSIGGINELLSQTIWTCLKEKGFLGATNQNVFFKRDFTIAIIYKADGREGPLLDGTASSSDNGKTGFSVAVDPKGNLIVDLENERVKLLAPLNDAHVAIISGMVTGNELKISLYLDGISFIQEIPAALATFSNCPGDLMIGHGRIGQDGFTGAIGEVVIYDNGLTIRERQRLEGYLSKKWKIDISGVDRIAAPALHLDASRQATVLLDDKTGILQWLDLSMGGHDAVQDNSQRRPGYTMDGINGLGVIRFTQEATNDDDGIRDIYEDYLTIAQIIQNDFTIMVVFQTDDSSIPSLLEDSGWTKGMALLDADCSGQYNDFGLSLGKYMNKMVVMGGIGDRLTGDHTIKTKGLEFTQPHFITFTRLKTSGEVKLYADGLLHGAADLRDDVILNDSRSIKIGAFNSEGIPFRGKIGEIIVFDTVLSDQTRQQIEKNLAAKWGIPFASLPLDIANLKLHLDASDFDSITAEPDNTVSQWYFGDTKGQVVATQNNPADRPIYVKDGINGMPGIRFNNSWMTITPQINSYDSFTMAVVFKPLSIGNIYPDWELGAGLVDNYVPGMSQNFGMAMNKQNQLLVRAGTECIQSAVAINCPHIAIFTRDSNTGDVKLYIDGLLAARQTFSNKAPLNGDSVILTIGAIQIQQPGQMASKGYYHGDIAELALFNGLLDLENIQALEKHLSMKWRIDTSGINRISKPVLHLDASQIRTIVKNGPDKISQWLDVNNYNNDAVQANPDQQPEYRLNAYNGLGAVHFDGTRATCFTLKPVVKDDFTIIIIYNTDPNISSSDYMPVSRDSFTRISGVTKDLSSMIWACLNEQGYIDSDGNVLPAFTPNQGDFTLNLSALLIDPIRLALESQINSILSSYRNSLRPVPRDAFTRIGGIDDALSSAVWANLNMHGYIDDNGYVAPEFTQFTAEFIVVIIQSAIINVVLAENWIAGAGLFDGNCPGERADMYKRDFGILVKDDKLIAGMGIPGEKDFKIEAKAPFGRLHMGILTRKKDTGMVKMYLDNVASEPVWVARNVTLNDSDRFTIGAVNTGGNYFSGDIAEIILLNEVPATDKIAAIQRFLAMKWDIPLTSLPIDTTSLCLHLDAANFESIIKEPDNTVSRWLYGYTLSRIAAIQNDPKTRPVYIENSLNGMPGMRFNRSFMSVTPRAAGDDDLTIAIVFNSLSTRNIDSNWAYGAGLIDNYSIEPEPNHFGVAMNRNNEFTLRIGTNMIKSPILANCPHIAVITSSGASGKVHMYIDGLLVSTGQFSPGLSLDKSMELTIGAIRIQPGDTESKGYYHGDIFELAMFNSIIDPESRLFLEKYLAKKWKIAISETNP
jgi:hypothetical protein